jgi:hypothetical protein
MVATSSRKDRIVAMRWPLHMAEKIWVDVEEFTTALAHRHPAAWQGPRNIRLDDIRNIIAQLPPIGGRLPESLYGPPTKAASTAGAILDLIAVCER